MKPQSFEYLAATDLGEALEALGEGGATVLAGGQSLVPLLAQRLVRARVLIDVNRCDELAGIATPSGALVLGALVRHRQLEREAAGRSGLGALFAGVAGHIGHLPVRVRGSFGGSLAYADPRAEWCLLAVTLTASIELASQRGRRRLGAREFLSGEYTTAAGPDELLVSVSLPRPAGWRYGFCEHARTDGTFATAGACAGLEVTGDTVASLRLGVMGLGGPPRRLPELEEHLLGASTGRVASLVSSEAPALLARLAPRPCPAHRLALAAALLGRATGKALDAPEEGA